MLMEAVHRFAANELRPAAHAADEQSALPLDLIHEGWQLGVLQGSIPERYGGFGERSAVTGVLAAEELAWGDLAAALAVLAPSSFALPVLLGGDDGQRADWLPRLAGLRWPPFSAALLEPQFDFTPTELRTRAGRANGGFVLSGTKVHVPFAEQAEQLLVFAELEGEPQAFVVPRDTAGVRIGDRQQLLGLRALPLYPVYLEQVRVTAGARLAQLDYASLLAGFQVATAASAIGLSRASYEYARDYAKQREAFGGPIAQKQAIAFMLAEMATEIDGARLMVWEAAWQLDQGSPGKAAYLALLGAADTAMMVTDRAVQILGGHGYIREHPVERWMRDARGIPTFLGLAMV
jgi:alkylation response protein AidB-like acyl-CoA dehydrogenase